MIKIQSYLLKSERSNLVIQKRISKWHFRVFDPKMKKQLRTWHKLMPITENFCFNF